LEKQNGQESSRQPLLLRRNYSYPTYQLYATAGGKKEAAFKIIILETLSWLRKRFRDFELPEELTAPEPKDYESFELSSLKSFSLNMGYQLEIVWLPEENLWCLQLTEPDFGVFDLDNTLKRPPVPGRLFETNVSCRMAANGTRLACKTIVHNPEGTTESCEVFRLSFIKHLVRNSLVDLRHHWKLKEVPHTLSGSDKIKRFKDDITGDFWALPVAVVCGKNPAAKKGEETNPLPPPNPGNLPNPFERPAGYPRFFNPENVLNKEEDEDPYPCDCEKLAHKTMGYAHVFILPPGDRKAFEKTMAFELPENGIVVFEPKNLGGKTTVYDFDQGNPKEPLESLTSYLQNYPAGKNIKFGDCLFVNEAAALSIQKMLEQELSKDKIIKQYKSLVKMTEMNLRDDLENEKNLRYLEIKRSRDLEEDIKKLKEEIASLRVQLEAAGQKYAAAQAQKQKEMEFYKSLQFRPQKPSEIIGWVESRFEGRLLLHERAIDSLNKVFPQDVDMNLLCDALEYLANEYLDFLKRAIDKEERDLLCSQKYDRPFCVVGNSNASIQKFPTEYKIKYKPGFKGKPVETVMDWHLRVGVDSAKLLRIYFLYDNEKQLIVIGYLPGHLSTASQF